MKLLVDYALGHHPPGAILRSTLQAVSLSATPTTLVALAAASSLLLFALSSALDARLTWSWAVAGQKMVVELAGDLFSRLQRLSLLFHARRPVGDSLDRLATDSWCVYSFTASSVLAPAQHLIAFTTVSLVAFRLDTALATLSLVGAPLLAASSVFFGRRLKRRARQSREAQSKLVSFVQQTFSSIPLVQAFGAEDRNTARFHDLGTEVVDQARRNAVVQRSFGLVNGLIATSGAAVVLYAGGLRVLEGTLSLGTLLVFIAYMRSLQRAAEGLLKVYGTMKPLEASIDRVSEILASKERVEDRTNARPAPIVPPAIRFDHVEFGYQAGHPVLHDVTLEIPSGQSLALVGPTGAGKSTIASLVPRFFDPWQGRVSFSGIDVRDLTIATLRERIAIVPQEPFLLPISVAENIGYGRRDAAHQEIVEAAVAANADGFIRGLPRGYETILGERAATLSGGERQRLAIARALLKNAPVVILDEPTSALDVKTEALIIEALERLLEGKTTLIIAHRLSTIRSVDRVAVLEQGRLVEAGTRAELLATPGIFRRFHLLQSTAAEQSA